MDFGRFWTDYYLRIFGRTSDGFWMDFCTGRISEGFQMTDFGPEQILFGFWTDKILEGFRTDLDGFCSGFGRSIFCRDFGRVFDRTYFG